jgi:hypothetical protein
MVIGMLSSLLMLASFTLLFQPECFPPAPAQLGEGSGGEPSGTEPARRESAGRRRRARVRRAPRAHHPGRRQLAGALR